MEAPVYRILFNFLGRFLCFFSQKKLEVYPTALIFVTELLQTNNLTHENTHRIPTGT